MARLQQHYRENDRCPQLKKDLGRHRIAMQVPKITKITVNMGVGEAVADRKVMDAAVADLTKITGQKPLISKSSKAIATFKLRTGLADRLQGDAARRAHVRVPRPAHQHRDAPHPRLPRRLAALVRRAAATTAWA